MIEIKTSGDFKSITEWLERMKELHRTKILNKYGQIGVEALSKATPVDSGKTASMWRYEIQNDSNRATLSFHNDNINKYINIAIILQYGHATGTGGWVEGRDYINPAIQPVFDEISKRLWKEVTELHVYK